MPDEIDNISRAILPIPDRQHVGLTTYDAKDPDTKFPPIESLRPPSALLRRVRSGVRARHRISKSLRATDSSTIASIPQRCARRRGRRC